MSWQTVQRVLDRSQSQPTDRIVLVAIAEQANKDGANAYPSVDTLARRSGKSHRATQESIQRLVELGELEYVVQGAAVKGRTPRTQPNLYRVLL